MQKVFHAITQENVGPELEAEILSQNKFSVTKDYIVFPLNRKRAYLPACEIVLVFIRIQDVKAQVCCGCANFPMSFLILRTASGQEFSVLLPSEESAKKALEEIKSTYPNIAIGFTAENRQLFGI